MPLAEKGVRGKGRQRLFVRGVFPAAAAGQESEVQIRVAGSGFILKNAAPGTAFGVFGLILITVMLVQGNPEFTYETLRKASAAPKMSAALDASREGTVSTKVTLRGSDPGGAVAPAVQRGIEFEKAGDSARAIDAYREALSGMALPMNQLAWLYFQQHRTSDALPLARLAADLSPDNPAVLDTLAEVLAGQGDRTEAARWMERAAALDPRYREKVAGLKLGGR